MEYFNNIVCVTYTELTDEVISSANYDNLVRRKKLRVVRRGCYGTPALIEYASLPQRIKDAIVEKYGNPENLAIENPIKKAWISDAKAFDFFSEYKLPNGKQLPLEKVKEFTATASALNVIHTITNNRKAYIKALGGNVNVWKTIIGSVKALQSVYGYVLPSSDKRLRLKVQDYIATGYESLISGKYCNNNSAKVIADEQEATLRKLLRDHRNLDNEQVRSLYNMVGEKLGWKTLSASTIANKREQWDLQIHSGRRGTIDFDNNKAMQVKRTAPSYPMLYWTVDGWDVELLYQKAETNKKGHLVTTYHNRLTVVIVLDPCTKYPVGYAIGTHETPELIREALRNAVSHTIEIFGQRYKPMQLQSDRYGNGVLYEFYSGVAKHYTPARAHNAKAKVIEPFLKKVNKCCQLLPNWSGYGVTARKENQPNAEYLNKIHGSFPDAIGCKQQIERIIWTLRKEVYDAYIKQWQASPDEYKLQFSDVDYLYYMGETKKDTNRLMPAGFLPTILGVTRTYDSFDATFRAYAHVDWITKYDPANLNNILVHNETGTLRFELTEKYVQPMALIERSEGDAKELQFVENFNKDLKGNILNKMEHDYDLVENMFTQNKELKDTLAKLVLVDSMGQHKNRKNANRLAVEANKAMIKDERKRLKQEQKTWQQEQEEYLNQKVDLTKYISN